MSVPRLLELGSLVDLLLRVRNRHLLVLDAVLLPISAYLAFALRLETLDLGPLVPAAVAYAIVAPFLKIPIFRALGIYSRFWRYATSDDAILLAWASVCGGLAEGALFLVILVPLGIVAPIPRSIPLIDIMLTLFCVAVPRFALRVSVQRANRWLKVGAGGHPSERVLIAGAGESGALVVHELEANPQAGLLPIGFVDDDRSKIKMYIHGCRVLGTRQAIPDLVREHAVDQVIIAMPTAPGRVIRETLDICNKAGVRVRTLPGVYDLLSGRVKLQQIRDVQIDDLLRREPVKIDIAQVSALIQGRRVMVTGGGGSIGSELCRQALRCHPAELILVGHGENSVFEIGNELARLAPGLPVTSVIADVRDRERLASVFARHQPEIVFHAAAHKHVPLMESNVEEAITNNVLGTRHLVEISLAAGVTHFVLISTDKAINPTSVMGASKRVAELIVQQAGLGSGRCYVAVRFGNVLGSRGSVVPFFQRQIASGGPVTVTHPEMRRYFMTIPEAVQLVLQAAVLGCGGEVFALDMGEPVRIVDLATDLIRLSGLEPGRDIEIVYTGIRPGEKLFEEVFADKEAHTRTTHEKILVCRNGADPSRVPPTLDLTVDGLLAAARVGSQDDIRSILQELVPNFKMPSTEATAAETLHLVAQDDDRAAAVQPTTKEAAMDDAHAFHVPGKGLVAP